MTAIRTFGEAGPLLGPDPNRTEGLPAYLAAGGYRDGPDPADLLARITAAGLRGRGGAGFPTATKIRSVAGRPGAKVVVANGEEGEPGSVKDRWLLRTRPHLVLDGLLRGAQLVGATRGFVYVSDPAAAAAVRGALAERTPSLSVTVADVSHAYVAGEETAVVRHLDGGPALPTAKPPRPYERGVGGAPTLISNVETLAQIALLAAGRTATTMLATLSGAQRPPALYELPIGTTLRRLTAAHGLPEIGGVLLGGLFGGLRGPEALDLALDGTIGCGAIHLLGPDDCPVALAADAVAFLSAESARQCGVCVMGTRSLADATAALTAGVATRDLVDKLTGWSARLPGRGACGLLDAAAALAGSLLRAFPDRVAAHLGGPCPDCQARPPAGGARLAVPPPAPRTELRTTRWESV